MARMDSEYAVASPCTSRVRQEVHRQELRWRADYLGQTVRNVPGGRRKAHLWNYKTRERQIGKSCSHARIQGNTQGCGHCLGLEGETEGRIRASRLQAIGKH